MQVLFDSHHPDGAPLRDLAVQRARFVLRRLSWLVPRARIRLSDDNGPRGGVDKRCRVEVQTAAGNFFVATAVARDWHVALNQALTRAARALLRNVQRTQQFPRGVA